MKRILIVTVAWLLGVLASCSTKTTELRIADEFMAFSDEQASFEPIKTAVKDKRIVILGEAGHTDGKTFEIKSKLIEFLNANNEYDVVLEGMGFLDGAVLQGVLPPQCINSNYLDVANAWYGLWSQTKEATPLVEAMRGGKVRIGEWTAILPSATISSSLICWLRHQMFQACWEEVLLIP